MRRDDGKESGYAMLLHFGKRLANIVNRNAVIDPQVDCYPMATAATDAELFQLAARKQAHRDVIRYQSEVLMFGGIATIWFGLRHDVSAVEAIASGALVVACVTVLVLIGRRARRVAVRRAGDVWNPRRESNPRSAQHECPPVRVGPPRWMPPSQSEQDVFASPPQRRTA